MALILVVGLVALPLLAGALLVAALVRRPDPAPSQAAEAARHHSAAVNTLGLMCLVGVVAIGVVITALAPGPTEGLYLGLLPAAAGLAFVAAQAIGELTWPRPTGSLRRAPLTRRTAHDVAPHWLRRVTRSWAALITATLVACGLAAHDGRQITRTFADGAASAGPFPGWFYGVPLLIAVGFLLVTAEAVLHLIARRPAVMEAAPEWDLGLRRLSAQRLLRGAQLTLGWTASGILVIAGAAVRNVGANGATNGIPVGSTGYAAVGVALVLVGGVVWLASVVLLFIPGRPAAQSLAASPILGPVPA